MLDDVRSQRLLPRGARAVRQRPWAGLSLLLGVLYAAGMSALTLARHDSYRTGAYDLGIFTQGVWLLGHGQDPFVTLRGLPLLGDHFQPGLVLLAPLGALGITAPGLLVAQAAALGLTAPLLHVLAERVGAPPRLACAVALLWCASPLVHTVNLFDFHPETLLAPLLVACALFLHDGHRLRFAAATLLAVSLKEDVALLYVVWGVLIWLSGRRRWGLALGVGAGMWFVLAGRGIAWSGGRPEYYLSTRYGRYGDSALSIVLSAAQQPAQVVGELLTAQHARVVLVLVLGTAGLCLLAPRWLVLAVPSLLANFLSAFPPQHETDNHYHLVPTVVVALAAAHGAAALGRPARARTASFVVAGCAVVAVASSVVSPAVPAVRDELAAPTPLAEAWDDALATVPEDAVVAATFHTAPHLAGRRDVYLLPEPFVPVPRLGGTWTAAQLERRAAAVEYVVLDDELPVTATPEERGRLAQQLDDAGFVERFSREGVVVLVRTGR